MKLQILSSCNCKNGCWNYTFIILRALKQNVTPEIVFIQFWNVLVNWLFWLTEKGLFYGIALFSRWRQEVAIWPEFNFGSLFNSLINLFGWQYSQHLHLHCATWHRLSCPRGLSNTFLPNSDWLIVQKRTFTCIVHYFYLLTFWGN